MKNIKFKFFQKKGIFIIPFIFFVFLACIIRPIKIVTENFEKIIICWVWDRGEVDFTNSVTGGKVKIIFNMKNGFNNFKMITDEKTENYYTSGTYDINKFLIKEKKNEMFFCSIIGMRIKLGSYQFLLKNNCASVEVLWPPKVIF